MTTLKQLHLVLKKQWFEEIALGRKSEEYRELKPYWEKRLLDYAGIKRDYKMLAFRRFLTGRSVDPLDYPRGFTHVTFRLGYHKDAPRMTFELESITIGKGKEEWGAKPDTPYFIIKMGKRIDMDSAITPADLKALGCGECDGSCFSDKGKPFVEEAALAWNYGDRSDEKGCFQCFKKLKNFK